MNQVNNQLFSAAFDLQKKWMDLLSPDSGNNGAPSSPKEAFDLVSKASIWSQSLFETMAKGLAEKQVSDQSLFGLSEKLKNTAKLNAMMFEVFSPYTQNNVDQKPKSDTGQDPSSSRPYDFSEVFKQLFGLSGFPATPPNPIYLAELLREYTKFMKDLSDRAVEPPEKYPQDINELKQFYKNWLGKYEHTLGRFVNMAHIGPNLYEMKKISKSLDAFFKYQAAATDFYSKMSTTGQETIDEISQELGSLMVGEITDADLDHFYKKLFDTGERRYRELFTSTLFCESLQSMVGTSLELKQALDEVTEARLESTPIVTQTQADEIHLEIYKLKKRIQSLEDTLSSTSQEKPDVNQ